MTTYLSQVYAHLEHALNQTSQDDKDPDRELWREYCLSEGLTEYVPALLPDSVYYRVTAKGNVVLRTRNQSSDSAKSAERARTRKKTATVNERMAAMLLADASLVNLSASQWVEKLGEPKVSATAVKLTDTWKKTIRSTRAMQKADRFMQKR